MACLLFSRHDMAFEAGTAADLHREGPVEAERWMEHQRTNKWLSPVSPACEETSHASALLPSFASLCEEAAHSSFGARRHGNGSPEAHTVVGPVELKWHSCPCSEKGFSAPTSAAGWKGGAEKYSSLL